MSPFLRSVRRYALRVIDFLADHNDSAGIRYNGSRPVMLKHLVKEKAVLAFQKLDASDIMNAAKESVVIGFEFERVRKAAHFIPLNIVRVTDSDKQV